MPRKVNLEAQETLRTRAGWLLKQGSTTQKQGPLNSILCPFATTPDLRWDVIAALVHGGWLSDIACDMRKDRITYNGRAHPALRIANL